MSEAKVSLKKWLPLKITQELSLIQLNRLVLVCTNSLALRVTGVHDGSARLDLLCESEHELLEAEVIINQVLADERLRDQISAKSDAKVTLLVETILTRVLGNNGPSQ